MKAHEIDVQVGDVRVSGVGCCFCDEAIAPSRLDPVTLVLTANDEKVSQVLWAHSRCLVAAGISDLHFEFGSND